VTQRAVHATNEAYGDLKSPFWRQRYYDEGVPLTNSISRAYSKSLAGSGDIPLLHVDLPCDISFGGSNPRDSGLDQTASVNTAQRYDCAVDPLENPGCETCADPLEALGCESPGMPEVVKAIKRAGGH
jgi:hypothetical protein